ncbi:DNA-binding transcriptional LysR family regulator [Cerasibacillus quisquiliarum]|uniref:HTH-type transcriptional regulator CzcR n=1 Tax=Cerasibacillus quisquiliarum TaxID=227865 RepID=A0A511UYP5_9BACI|nr:LysR family transcriptional regulator [Cerasibacillus quisquiliarum]MBB5146911.1 DNA-binding transcriptional LysR family regulator [Cerasibacillus quisquiliarum]GEN31766.1 HTH-type transcriptional regulator CzcR [Cerasibacillus quisquiliarum]
MDLKDLYIFQKVAEKGNVSKAAEALNYVQSNVTTRIQKLEEELHTPLFHRHNRGMVLTPEGRKLITYAEKIISIVNEMKKVMHDSDQPVGKLEIGTVETVIKLPFILSKYNKQYEHVDLSLTSGVTKELIDQVLHYKLDGAFVTGNHKSAHPDLVQYKAFEEELVLVTDNTPTTIEEIKQKPLLVFRSGCGYRSKLREWLRDEQVVPTKIMELGTLETILGSVYSGLGVTFIPYSAVQHHEARGLIQCHHLPEKYSKIDTLFICRKDAYQTASLEKFIETLQTCKNDTKAPLPFI